MNAVTLLPIISGCHENKLSWYPVLSNITSRFVPQD